jgi:hypothetical protein
MSTSAPAPVKQFPESSIEKKVYNLVETFAEFLPIANDRNRLSFCLLKYLNGEGDKPEILVKSQKMKITGISHIDLAEKIKTGLSEIQK